jgi:hypothetical protein
MPGSVPLQQCNECGTLHEYRVPCPFCLELKNQAQVTTADIKVTKEMINELIFREKPAK